MVKHNETIRKISKFVGSKLYDLRLGRGMSRKELSRKIDVSQQQLMKYETGGNHISAGRLSLIAKVFGIDIKYFYEGLEFEEQGELLTQSQRMCLETSRNFMQIKNTKLQNAINILVEEITVSE